MKQPATRSGVRGFTLLEMLVALAIFSLLAVMSYGGLAAVLEQQFRTEAEAERLAALQKAYLVMQRDIEQVVARPVRDGFGDEQPALAGDQALEFTRGGWSNPLGRPRSALQRVAYAWEERQLRRYVWQVLDRAQDSQPVEQLLLDNIEYLQIRYLLAEDDWKEQWPAQLEDTGTNEAAAAPAVLPAAVEVTIEHEHYGLLVWLFQLPL
ncbi:MAG: type II secretion system minor pseudopilin GspJ [Gammaproteobacteria bacterium]